MYAEEDLLPLSALADLAFCERRAALHRIEGVWTDSQSTMEGELLHHRVDQGGEESRGSVRVARGVALRSLRLGLAGKADVVEFHRAGPGEPGAAVPGFPGRWRPYPVEYKRGRLRHEEGFALQLCAQGLCLEEMLGVVVPAGAIFYGRTRRRLHQDFDAGLRERTAAAALRLHELVREGSTPAAEYGPKCRECSLERLCLPRACGGRTGRAAAYVAGLLEEM